MTHRSAFRAAFLAILIASACSLPEASAYRFVTSSDLSYLGKNASSAIVLPKENLFFYPQAPLGNWEKQNESCEEASASLLYRNSFRQTGISAEEFDAEIDGLNDFQTGLGIPKSKITPWRDGTPRAYIADVTPEQIADMFMEKYFRLSSDSVMLLKHPTIDDMERLLANRFMLLVPLNTYEVKNYYANHATYHIMPVVGYSTGSFLSMDVATRRGFLMPYEKDVLMNSIRNNGDAILFINSPLAQLSNPKQARAVEQMHRVTRKFRGLLTKRIPHGNEDRKRQLNVLNFKLVQRLEREENQAKRFQLTALKLVVQSEIKKELAR